MQRSSFGLLTELAPAKSSPKTGTCQEKKSLVLSDAVHRGVWIRPWRGPLTRPKPALVIVLRDFLPTQFINQLSYVNQNLTNKTPEADKRRVINVSADVGVVGLTQQVGPNFLDGPKIDLQQSRMKRLWKNLMLIDPRLVAAKQPQKPSSMAINQLSGTTLPRARVIT
jgi:hypothetical protein